MANELAALLHDNGSAHASAACLLYRASLEQADRENVEDRARYAFNGPYSLSVQYLLGLGIELMLKAVIAAGDRAVDGDFLRKRVGHDLAVALEMAEQAGLAEEAQLRDLVGVLREPYRQHWLRYERPAQFALPDDFDEVVKVLTDLEHEVAVKVAS